MELIDKLKKYGQYKKYVGEETIFHEGEYCSQVGFVLKGVIHIISYGLEGEEELISIIKENQFFANALIFSENNKYLGEVIVKKDTELILISKENLLLLLQEDESFLEFYLNSISKKTISLSLRTKLLSKKKIRDRILFYFEIHHGVIHQSVTAIAHEIILPRPSVSRELQKMIKEGILVKNHSTWKIKKAIN